LNLTLLKNFNNLKFWFSSVAASCFSLFFYLPEAGCSEKKGSSWLVRKKIRIITYRDELAIAKLETSSKK
jgi:hypothetical protein